MEYDRTLGQTIRLAALQVALVTAELLTTDDIIDALELMLRAHRARGEDYIVLHVERAIEQLRRENCMELTLVGGADDQREF